MNVLERLAKLEKRATPGPWKVDHLATCHIKVRLDEQSIVRASDADAALIAAMRNALPALLEVARVAGRYAEAREGDDRIASADAFLDLREALAKLTKETP